MADTLDHTRPEEDLYRLTDDFHVEYSEPIERLSGEWVHCLLGNGENHFHNLVMNVGRLALLTDDVVRRMSGVLISAPRVAVQSQLWDAISHTWGQRYGDVRFREVRPGECLNVESLTVPWDVGSERGLNTSILPFLRSLAAKSGERVSIYIDRSGAVARKMRNEDMLISVLQHADIHPIRLEFLTFKEQAKLFADCDLVVGAHGAGLANIVFMAPGTKVIEIMPDKLQAWHYRALSISCGLDYDCLLARSEEGPPALSSFTVSPTHVLSAIEFARSR